MKYIKALQKAHQQGRLAHAYLLCGNDTAAKEQVIEELLTTVLGSEHQHTVLEIAPETSEITIDQIRKLKEQLSLSSWGSTIKVGVIRSADHMNQEAQSAFLKLLEEPRGDVLLLLEAQHSSLLLDTLRSRLQELRFFTFSKGENATTLLSKLQQVSIADRFAWAQEKSQDVNVLKETLLDLYVQARTQFLQELEKNDKASPRILLAFKEVLEALKQTQVNPRYATERLLLEL